MERRNLCKIAVVEDEFAHAILVSYHLERMGYHVQSFKQGETLLQNLDTDQFGLMIVNAQLGDIGGLRLCQKIRYRAIDTPILFLSTGVDKESCQCDETIDFLFKPFPIRHFTEKVAQLVQC